MKRTLNSALFSMWFITKTFRIRLRIFCILRYVYNKRKKRNSSVSLSIIMSLLFDVILPNSFSYISISVYQHTLLLLNSDDCLWILLAFQSKRPRSIVFPIVFVQLVESNLRIFNFTVTYEYLTKFSIIWT